jgi:hypothetical protein
MEQYFRRSLEHVGPATVYEQSRRQRTTDATTPVVRRAYENVVDVLQKVLDRRSPSHREQPLKPSEIDPSLKKSYQKLSSVSSMRMPVSSRDEATRPGPSHSSVPPSIPVAPPLPSSIPVAPPLPSSIPIAPPLPPSLSQVSRVSVGERAALPSTIDNVPVFRLRLSDESSRRRRVVRVGLTASVEQRASSLLRPTRETTDEYL